MEIIEGLQLLEMKKSVYNRGGEWLKRREETNKVIGGEKCKEQRCQHVIEMTKSNAGENDLSWK